MSADRGAGAVTLGYDPLGRLDEIGGAAAARGFQYDGWDRIAEYDGTGALQHRWVHGPSVDEPLVRYDGSGTSARTFLHADIRGSIIAHSDSAGARTAALQYDEAGVRNVANPGHFQYTGQIWIGELELYYYKNRFLDPQLYQFISADPIGLAGGLNLYAYAGNDPVNMRDPLGLSATGGAEDPDEIIPVDGKRILSEETRGTFGRTGGARWHSGSRIGYYLSGLAPGGDLGVFRPFVPARRDRNGGDQSDAACGQYVVPESVEDGSRLAAILAAGEAMEDLRETGFGIHMTPDDVLITTLATPWFGSGYRQRFTDGRRAAPGIGVPSAGIFASTEALIFNSRSAQGRGFSISGSSWSGLIQRSPNWPNVDIFWSDGVGYRQLYDAEDRQDCPHD